MVFGKRVFTYFVNGNFRMQLRISNTKYLSDMQTLPSRNISKHLLAGHVLKIEKSAIARGQQMCYIPLTFVEPCLT